MEIYDSKTILEQEKCFMLYKNLYTAAPYNGSNYKLFFENSNIARLEATQLEELERPLLYEECFLILKCSKIRVQEQMDFLLNFIYGFGLC